MPENREKAQQDALAIFRAAVARVDPFEMLVSALSIEGGELVVRTELDEARYPLADYDRIVVAGMGKAAAAMARGAERVLGERIAGGVVAVKAGYADRLTRLSVVEAGHPLPDRGSLEAADRILALGRGLDERSLAIVLISGGGSSVACAPADGLSLEDKTATTGLLLSCGATIQEVNCVRKHLSAIKGGRLAAAYRPATVLSLVLSDVIGDGLDAIASGPTVPDPTSFAEALDIVRRRGLESLLPSSVAQRLRAGAAGSLPDTPKPGDRAFERARTVLLGTNTLALLAARKKAVALGYSSLVLTSRLTGEARLQAPLFLAIGQDIAASGFPLARPACLIAGGETTVTLRGSGKGGRNQEMALAFLSALGKSPAGGEGLLFLAASTDGSDGPTDAAGAFASREVLRRAGALSLDPDAFLADNDSYSFFDSCGALLRTGPTKTNVCDIQLLLVI